MSRQQVHNASVAQDVGRANLLVNGGFEQWQRGNGPFGLQVYSADMWFTNYSASPATFNASIVRSTAQTDTAERSQSCWKWTNFTTSGGQYAWLVQYLKEIAPQVPLATLTFSMRVKCNAPNAVRLSIYADANAGGGGATMVQAQSAYHSGSNQYETLSVSIVVPVACNYLQVQVFFMASCAGCLDNGMLVIGSQAVDYVPMHPADELARCERYFEIYGNSGGGNTLTMSQCISTTQAVGEFWFKYKAVAPTVTVNGVANSYALTGPGGAYYNPSVLPSVTPVTFRQAMVTITTSAVSLVAGQATRFVNYTSGGYFYVEANP